MGSEILSESGVAWDGGQSIRHTEVRQYQYQKSDKIYARMLCRLYRDGQLKGYTYLAEQEDLLKLLLRHRNILVRNLRRIKTR
ncbi:MAG: hypothetical protein IPM26_16650 [Saprospiraceae bacterium]|nr:hypothetical protein [Saprospiraceae bacterium]